MYQHRPPAPYGKGIILVLAGCTLLGIVFCVAAGTNSIVGGIGAAFFAGAISVALVIDWRGTVSLRGFINWSRLRGKKKWWLILAWICFFPLFFCIYLVRVAIHQFSAPALPGPAPAPKRVKVGLVVGSLVVCLGLISAFGSAGATATVPPVTSSAHIIAASTPVGQDTPTQAPALTFTPTPLPTDTPVPTPTPTPKPEPTPTPQPHCQAVNDNPWCYNFTPGNLIYTPPSDFCSYFACISNFWNGTGYVIECQDAMYSKSGGRRGSCSHHGGNLQPLYSY